MRARGEVLEVITEENEETEKMKLFIGISVDIDRCFQ